MQGYAAKEFASQGVKPGELAVISKEAVKLWKPYYDAVCLVNYDPYVLYIGVRWLLMNVLLLARAICFLKVRQSMFWCLLF